jgi:hypothetical protein
VLSVMGYLAWRKAYLEQTQPSSWASYQSVAPVAGAISIQAQYYFATWGRAN